MPISLPPSFWSNLEELSIRSGAFRKSLLPCSVSFIKTTYLGICPLSFPAHPISFLPLEPMRKRNSRGPELTQIRWLKGSVICYGKAEDHPGPPCVGRLTFAWGLPKAVG